MSENQNVNLVPDRDVSSDIQNEIQARFQLLPKELQDELASGEYNKILMNVAKEQKLTFEDLETLQLETVLVLLGINSIDNYRSMLQSELKKDDNQMDALISALNQQLFDKVKVSLEQVYSNKDQEYQAPSETNERISDIEQNTQSFETSIPVRAIPSMSAQAGPSTRFAMPNPISQNNLNQTQNLTADETNVLGKAGVEINTPKTLAGNANIDESMLPNRNDLMQGIENPSQINKGTIMANKLSMSSTLMPNKTTDYSLPRSSGPSNSASVQKNNVDPYREQI